MQLQEEVGIEGDTQFKPGVGEWTLGTAWPAAPRLLLSCTGRCVVSGLAWSLHLGPAVEQ